MPVKSNVRKGANKGGFKFRWWMVLVLVVVVAVVGIAVLRFSHASGQYAYIKGQEPRLASIPAGSNDLPQGGHVFNTTNNLYTLYGRRNSLGYTFTVHFPNNFTAQVHPYDVDPSGNLIFRIQDPANTDCGV